MILVCMDHNLDDLVSMSLDQCELVAADRDYLQRDLPTVDIKRAQQRLGVACKLADVYARLALAVATAGAQPEPMDIPASPAEVFE